MTRGWAYDSEAADRTVPVGRCASPPTRALLTRKAENGGRREVNSNCRYRPICLFDRYLFVIYTRSDPQIRTVSRSLVMRHKMDPCSSARRCTPRRRARLICAGCSGDHPGTALIGGASQRIWGITSLANSPRLRLFLSAAIPGNSMSTICVIRVFFL